MTTNHPEINAFADAQRRIWEALRTYRTLYNDNLDQHCIVLSAERLAAIIRDAPFYAADMPERLFGFPIVIDNNVDIVLRHEVVA